MGRASFLQRAIAGRALFFQREIAESAIFPKGGI